MGAAEVERFLVHLATDRQVAPSTHRQALAALLFLYRQVLDIDLPWLQEIGRPKSPVRIPVVLSREEVAQLFANIDDSCSTIAALLYGAGLRLMECLRLRVKDIDFERRIIIVREGKGRKDRVVVLPEPARAALQTQIGYSRAIWMQPAYDGVPMSAKIGKAAVPGLFS
jgi:integrase